MRVVTGRPIHRGFGWLCVLPLLRRLRPGVPHDTQIDGPIKGPWPLEHAWDYTK